MSCSGGGGRGGNSFSIYERFSGKKRTSLYISCGKANIITSKHGTTIFLSHYNLFLKKIKEKLAQKARVTTEQVYRIVLIIIIIKQNFIYRFKKKKKILFRRQEKCT